MGQRWAARLRLRRTMARPGLPAQRRRAGARCSWVCHPADHHRTESTPCCPQGVQGRLPKAKVGVRLSRRSFSDLFLRLPTASSAHGRAARRRHGCVPSALKADLQLTALQSATALLVGPFEVGRSRHLQIALSRRSTRTPGKICVTAAAASVGLRRKVLAALRGRQPTRPVRLRRSADADPWGEAAGSYSRSWPATAAPGRRHRHPFPGAGARRRSFGPWSEHLRPATPSRALREVERYLPSPPDRSTATTRSASHGMG